MLLLRSQYLVATVIICLTVATIVYSYNRKDVATKSATDVIEVSSDNNPVIRSNIEDGSTNKEQSIIHTTIRPKEGLNKEKRVSSMLYKKFYDEKKSNQIFSWIKLNGLNHPDSTKKLREFRKSGGGWLYSIDLIKIINEDESVSDLNTSLVLKIITDSYEGGVYSDGSFSIAKNNKDIEIQNFLKLQLEEPKGEASFYEALRNADILDQGYSLYQLIDIALQEHGDLLDESAIYKYKIKYSQNLPVQLQTNLEKINSLPKKKQKELSYLIYDSINSFSDNSLVVMTEEVKEQYQKFLNENKTQVPIFTDEQDQLKELNFESLTEVEKWQKKNQEAVSQYQQKAERFIENLSSQMILDNISDKQAYLYQYALNTDSVAETLVILQQQVEEASLNENDDSFSKFSNSDELKYKLENKLSDPSLTSQQKEEIRSAIDTYFDISPQIRHPQSNQ